MWGGSAPPNGSRLSCGRLARLRKSSGRQSVPRQGRNTPVPLKRSPPASFKRLLGSALALPLSFQPVEGREDETGQLRVLSKEDTGDRHYFATRIGAHPSNYQRGTEEGACCELPFSTSKERRPGAASKIDGDEYS